MSTISPLVVKCPQCAAAEVFYSCEPECCFNHICARCRATFETATRAVGASAPGARDLRDGDERESDAPTAQCCVCDSLELGTLADGRAVCTACGAVLELVLENVQPG